MENYGGKMHNTTRRRKHNNKQYHGDVPTECSIHKEYDQRCLWDQEEHIKEWQFYFNE